MKKKVLIVLVAIIFVEAAVASGFGFAYYNEKQRRDLKWDAALETTRVMWSIESNFSILGGSVIGGRYDYYEDQVYMYIPGTYTDAIISNLNDYIVENSMDPSVYGLSYPITTEGIIDNPEGINDLVHNGILAVEMAKGSDESEAKMHIDLMLGDTGRIKRYS